MWKREKSIRTQTAPDVPILVKWIGFRRQRCAFIYPARPSPGLEKNRYSIGMSLLDYSIFLLGSVKYDFLHICLILPFPRPWTAFRVTHIKDSQWVKQPCPAPRAAGLAFCGKSERKDIKNSFFSFLFFQPDEMWKMNGAYVLRVYTSGELSRSEKSEKNSK